jgi:hypothetical protein
MGLRLHPRHPGVAPLDVAGQRLVHGLVAKGEVRIDSGSDPTEVLTRLAAIPGIGPWTAAYVAMRGFHDPDAFPHGDAGLRRALQPSVARTTRVRSRTCKGDGGPGVPTPPSSCGRAWTFDHRPQASDRRPRFRLKAGGRD